MGETLKKSAKSDVVEMSPQKKGSIALLFGAKEKTKKKKAAKSTDRYKADWDAQVDDVDVRIKAVPAGSPFDGDRQTLVAMVPSIRDARIAGKRPEPDLVARLTDLGNKADTLKGRWDSHCETLLASKLTRITKALEEVDSDARRFAKAADKANLVVRDHGPVSRQDLADEIDKINVAQASHVVEISRLNGGKQFADPLVDLATFSGLVDAISGRFQTMVATAIKDVETIAKRPGRDQAERNDFLYNKLPVIGPDDPFGTRKVFDIQEARAAEAATEHARLETAVTAMTARMEELKLLRAGQDPQKVHDAALAPLLDPLKAQIKTLAAEKKAAERQLARVMRYATPDEKDVNEDDGGNSAEKKSRPKATPEVLQLRKEAKAVVAKGNEAIMDEVARLEQKMVQVQADIAKKEAEIERTIARKSDELAILKRDALIDMSADGKKALEDEYNILKDQIEVIKAREKAFKAFKDGENARVDAMMAIREEREAQTAKVAALVTAANAPGLRADDPALAFLSDVSLRDASVLGLDPEIDRLKNAGTRAEALTAENVMLQSEVARIHATVDRGHRVTPTEPEMTRISKAEHDMLMDLLTKVAPKLIDAQDLETAAKVHMKVRSLLIAFQNDTARQTAVPPAAPAEPDREKDLVRRLNQLEVPIMALAAKRMVGADALETARKALIAAITVEAAKPQPDWNGIERQVDTIETDVANPVLPAPSAALLDARDKAGKARDEINAALAGIYNSDRMSPEEIARIDLPGKVWPKDAKGKTTKPEAKDLIAPEDVIWVVENKKKVAYRIDTKETGGKDIARRGKGHHHVPREMMALIRSDAEVLDLMVDSEVEEMAGVTAEFIATAQARHAAVTDKTANETYKKVEETIKTISEIISKDPLIGHNTLLRMHPDGLAEAKKEFEAFKKDWTRMLPDEAKTGASALLDRFEKIKKESAKLEKTYEASKDFAKASLKSFKTGLDVVDDMGFFANDLIGKAGPALTKDDRTALRDVARQMQSVDDYRGGWMAEIKAAHRLLKEKSTTAVTEGTAMLEKTQADIATFSAEFAQIAKLLDKDTLSRGEQEIIADFARKAARVMESAVEGKRKHEEAKDAWTTALKKLEDGIAEAKTEIAKKALATILEQRRDAIKKRRDAMKDEVKEFQDYDWANRHCAELQADVAQLTKDAKADANKTEDSLFKPVAGKRAQSVDKWLRQLQSEILRLDFAYLADRADDSQKVALDDAFHAVEASMKQAAKGLGDATNLIVQCSQIDAKMADPTDAYANKLKRREAAMAECRRIRFALDENPALELFRQNPFPELKPTALLMLKGALHSCEMAILDSVDPRTAKKST